MRYSEIKIPRPQIREFCACIFCSLTASTLQDLQQKCATFCQVLSCRKGLTALQRQPRCRATTAPLEHESGPATEPGEPRWLEITGKRNGSGDKMSIFRRQGSPELKFPSVKFRDIIMTEQVSIPVVGRACGRFLIIFSLSAQ